MILASPRTHLNVLLALALLTIAAAGSFHLAHGLVAKADTFYIHYLGYKWWQRDDTAAAIQKYRPKNKQARYEMARREVAAFNYPLAAAANRITGLMARKIWPEAYTKKQGYPKALLWAIGMAHGLGFLAGLGVIALVFLRCREFIPPFALTVGVLALISFLPGPIPSDQLLLYSGHEFVFNVITLVVNPGESFSAVSFWPKCTVALLLIGVMALRWSDSFAAAYGLMIVMAVFHIGLAVVVFFIFAGIDFIFRPRKLLKWQVILTAGILGALLIFNGPLWFLIQTMSPTLMALIGLATLTIFYLLRRFIAPLSIPYTIRRTDVVTLVGGLAIAFPIVILGYLASAPETPWGPHSTWVQIISRIIVFAATVTLFALATESWEWLERRLGPIDGLRTLVVTLIVAGLMSLYGATGAWWLEGRAMVSSINKLDTDKTEPTLTHIYYNIIRSLDVPAPPTGRDSPEIIRPAQDAGSNK